MDMRHPLDGVNAKIGRAKKHLEELKVDIQARWNNGECGVPRHFDDKTREGVDYALVPYKLRVHWGIMIGDVVHNTRAALDHLALQLALQGGGRRGRTAFPIYLTLAEYRHAQGQNAVRGMEPYAIALIESLRPKNTDDPLWILKKLDDEDKHNLVNVSASVVRMSNLSVGGHPQAGPVQVLQHLQGQSLVVIDDIEDGADVLRFTLDHRTPHMAVQTSGTLVITFAKSGPGKGHPISPLLPELIEYVETGVVPLFRLDKIPAKVPTWTPPG